MNGCTSSKRHCLSVSINPTTKIRTVRNTLNYQNKTYSEIPRPPTNPQHHHRSSNPLRQSPNHQRRHKRSLAPLRGSQTNLVFNELVKSHHDKEPPSLSVCFASCVHTKPSRQKCVRQSACPTHRVASPRIGSVASQFGF